MGASAQTGIAVLQSGEFWALVVRSPRNKQHIAQNRALIEFGAKGYSVITFITPKRTFLVFFNRKIIQLIDKLHFDYRLSEKWF